MLQYVRQIPWQIHVIAYALAAFLALGIAAELGAFDSSKLPESLPLYGESGQLLGHCHGQWPEEAEGEGVRFVVKSRASDAALCTEGHSEMTYAQPSLARFNNDLAAAIHGPYLLRVPEPPHSAHIVTIVHELHFPENAKAHS